MSLKILTTTMTLVLVAGTIASVMLVAAGSGIEAAGLLAGGLCVGSLLFLTIPGILSSNSCNFALLFAGLALASCSLGSVCLAQKDWVPTAAAMCLTFICTLGVFAKTPRWKPSQEITEEILEDKPEDSK